MVEFSPLQMALMRNATAVTPFDQSPGFGGYLAEAMAQQSQQNVQRAQAESADYALNKERQMQDLLSRIDINDPNAIAELMKVAPEVGIKLMQQQRLVKQQQMAEEMMSGGMGAGGDIGALDRNAAAAGMMGNEPLADYFTRQAERAYDLEKEDRKLQQDIEKEARTPPTESQANAANFATRMVKADQEILTPLEMAGVSTADTEQQLKKSVPGVGNFLTSNEFQSYNQAAEDWVRAKLRKESGAVIGEEEMNREITTYFPVPGDSPQVIEQKRLARQTAVEGVIGGTKPGSVKKPMPALKGLGERQIEIGGKTMKARQAPDGNFYVERDGKFFKVEE
jgi:hypothetical protein